jgi:hypothetical protein
LLRAEHLGAAFSLAASKRDRRMGSIIGQLRREQGLPSILSKKYLSISIQKYIPKPIFPRKNTLLSREDIDRREHKIKADVSLSVFLNEERQVAAEVFPAQILRARQEMIPSSG